MAKKIIFGICISFLVVGILFYFDTFQLNRDVIENIQWLIWDIKGNPADPEASSFKILSETRILEEGFNIEKYVTGLDIPTTMAFVGNDILVLEKNYGKVRLIRNGSLQQNPVIDLDVANSLESGLLGITTVNSSVYLYYTKSIQDGGEPLGNYIYKFYWDGQSLQNPEVLNVLPGSNVVHHGGAMTSDQDGNVFAVIGDQTPFDSPFEKQGRLLNNENGHLDPTGIIILVGTNGSGNFSSTELDPTKDYFAMGIRNSFGLAVDPITNNLWDTENGLYDFDEINLVHPRFNSGWAVTMGPTNPEKLSEIPPFLDFEYSDPEFSWEKTIGPTAITFVDSEKFKKYQHMLFVSDCNNGNIYKFTLNESRTGFVFNDPNLQDLVLNRITTSDEQTKTESNKEILFGTGFGCISDLEFGPDGSLYVVSISHGNIYRITPD